MEEHIVSIPKRRVAVAIFISGVMFLATAYYGWGDTSWANAHTQVIVDQICCVILGVLASMLLIGLYAKHVGYTKDELNKWGDDALSGKPPL